MRHGILSGGLLVFSLFISAAAQSQSAGTIRFHGKILPEACRFTQSAGELQMQCAQLSGRPVVQSKHVAATNENSVSPQAKIEIRWLNSEKNRGIATLTQV